MRTFSVGGAAEHLTAASNAYVAPWQVYLALMRLVTGGRIPERRAGRQWVVFDEDLPLIAAELGIDNSSSGPCPHGSGCGHRSG
jgi:hypothetical protein